MSKQHRYELFMDGYILAKYETLGQALLGALWRSRKRMGSVYVWEIGKHERCIAKVVAVPEAYNE